MDLTQVFYGLITWLPLCIWILCLVHWAVSGDIETVAAIIGIAAALVIGVIAIRPPMPILAPIACGTAYLTVISYPILYGVSQRNDEKKMKIEEVAAAYQAIGQNPSNQLAKFKLARAVYNIGYVGHAVAIGDASIGGMPRRVIEEEFRMLSKWKRVGVPPESLQPIMCVDCHTLCQPGWTHCRNCGAPFLLDRVKGRLMPGPLAQKLIVVWGCAVLLCIGLPLAATLAPALALACIIALFGIVAAIVFVSFRSGTELAT